MCFILIMHDIYREYEIMASKKRELEQQEGDQNAETTEKSPSPLAIKEWDV